MSESWLYLDIVYARAVVKLGHCSCLNRGYIWTMFMPERSYIFTLCMPEPWLYLTLLMPEPWLYSDTANV